MTTLPCGGNVDNDEDRTRVGVEGTWKMSSPSFCCKPKTKNILIFKNVRKKGMRLCRFVSILQIRKLEHRINQFV